jgi:hypothetical protein
VVKEVLSEKVMFEQMPRSHTEARHAVTLEESRKESSPVKWSSVEEQKRGWYN